MTWKDLLQIKITDHWGISVDAGPLLIGVVVTGFVLILVHLHKKRKLLSLDIVEAEVSLGGIGKIKIKPSNEDVRIAHKAWVELITRKVALPFDEEHDVIVEVYDSWYALFKEMRSLAKEIPAEKLRNSKDTCQLVHLLVDSLNQGLRPHLTRWQARFRRWYKTAIDAIQNDARSPQEIQKDYPHYAELVEDLKSVNKQAVEYANVIKRIAHGNGDSSGAK